MPGKSIIELEGHLTKDPVVGKSPGQKDEVKFTLAVNHGFGEHQYPVFYNIKVYSYAFFQAQNYKKGDAVYLKGEFNPWYQDLKDNNGIAKKGLVPQVSVFKETHKIAWFKKEDNAEPTAPKVDEEAQKKIEAETSDLPF